ncbi:MAG: O-antigen ligase family protein [Patescibacteria group bacterium]
MKYLKDAIWRIRSLGWFGLVWRLAVLSLPWQTRWFHEAKLAGWPWEQGSSAFYVSWIPLIFAVVLGFIGLKEDPPKDEKKKKWIPWLWVSSAVLLCLSVMRSVSFEASAQWCIQAGVLCVFVYVLHKRNIAAKTLATWLSIAILPHALLAYMQFAVQRVDSWSWLGIAFQSPKQLGVSVVEFADMRYLRAYGGMPHPNILGGWLAMGTIVAVWSAWRSATKRRALAFAAAAAVFSGALVLTFSRSAFLATAVGCAALMILFFVKRREKKTELQFGLMALVCAAVFAAILGFSQREVLLARTQDQSRLEVKSSVSRTQSLKDGWEVFKRRWILGSGPNAELKDLAMIKFGNEGKQSSEPLESPHNSFFLLVVDFGVVGGLIVLWAVFLARRKLLRRWYFILPLSVLAWFDHYLWSYWSGMVLLAVILSLAAVPDTD